MCAQMAGAQAHKIARTQGIPAEHCSRFRSQTKRGAEGGPCAMLLGLPPLNRFLPRRRPSASSVGGEERAARVYGRRPRDPRGAGGRSLRLTGLGFAQARPRVAAPSQL